MTPNATDAALAATRPSEYILSLDGTSREVYLINGIVYKVAIGHFRDNEFEYANIVDVTKGSLPDSIRFPAVAMFGDVIAMEYVEGIRLGFCVDCECGDPCQYGDCLSPDIAIQFNALGFRDLAYGNVILKDGYYYLVDAVS